MSILLVLVLVLSFAACAKEEKTSSKRQDRITINVYNWGQYISDGSDDCLDVIAAFEERYPNIEVNYSTRYMEELFMKVRNE